MKRIFTAVLVLALLCTGLMPAAAETGSAKGFGGNVVVTLTIDNGKIVDCAIDASCETPAIGGAAAEALAAKIVEAGSAEVDSIAGATVTSDAVKAAVAAALNPAANDTFDLMVPGTYTGSALGLNDQVKVEVVVTEKTIESVVVTYNQESPGIGAVLPDKDGNTCENVGLVPVVTIPEAIVANQSLAVDTVSGATVTSNAVIKAVGAALEAAGADLADWQNEVVNAEVVVAETADVIVIGGGGAGLSAAISAAQAGANVIVLEKTALLGGDTLVCGGFYNTWDPEGQGQLVMSESVTKAVTDALAETPANDVHAALIEEVKTEWEAFNAEGKTSVYDSAAWFALQSWNGGDKVADLEIVRKFANNSYDAYLWLRDMGMEFTTQVVQAPGALWERSHGSVMNMGIGYMSTYLNELAKMDNVSILLNMNARSLVTDENGKVVGVVAEDINGASHTFTANSGVILATGGYGANAALVQEHNTSGKWNDLSTLPTTNRYHSSQGDGIFMATAIGAATRDMEQIQLLFLGNLDDGSLSKYPPRCTSGIVQTIFINKNGERFVREDGRRDEVCNAILAQPDQMFYVLESADGSLYTDINDPAWRSADGFTRAFLEENGYMFVAETLDELAAKLGIDAAAIKATIDDYNTCADAGADSFGRTNFGCKLENGPYVATPRQASIHHTMGGLKIDADTHVINTDGEIIDGLYAAGEVIGGLHGANRLGGNAVTDVIVFGRLAGENAAANK